jgi:hypothetical protein
MRAVFIISHHLSISDGATPGLRPTETGGSPTLVWTSPRQINGAHDWTTITGVLGVLSTMGGVPVSPRSRAAALPVRIGGDQGSGLTSLF